VEIHNFLHSWLFCHVIREDYLYSEALVSRDTRRLIQAFFATPPPHPEETGNRNDFAKKRAKSIQSPLSRGLGGVEWESLA
jgi:hypothetical protein